MATKPDAAFGAMEPEEIAPDVMARFANYSDAFNRRDANAICEQFVGLPYVEFAQSGELIIRSSRNELIEQYESAFSEFEATDWSHTDFFDIEVIPMSDNVAVLSATCNRYQKDGSVLVSGKKVMYVFRRLDGEWRIAAYTYLADHLPNVTTKLVVRAADRGND